MAAALLTFAALYAIALCGLNAWIKLAASALVLVHAGMSLRRFLSPRFVHATWLPSGHWRLRDRAGGECNGALRDAVVLGGAIVLRLDANRKRHLALVLVPDNCDTETRRRLRVRLMRADAIAART